MHQFEPYVEQDHEFQRLIDHFVKLCGYCLEGGFSTPLLDIASPIDLTDPRLLFYLDNTQLQVRGLLLESKKRMHITLEYEDRGDLGVLFIIPFNDGSEAGHLIPAIQYSLTPGVRNHNT